MCSNFFLAKAKRYYIIQKILDLKENVLVSCFKPLPAAFSLCSLPRPITALCILFWSCLPSLPNWFQSLFIFTLFSRLLFLLFTLWIGSLSVSAYLGSILFSVSACCSFLLSTLLRIWSACFLCSVSFLFNDNSCYQSHPFTCSMIASFLSVLPIPSCARLASYYFLFAIHASFLFLSTLCSFLISVSAIFCSLSALWFFLLSAPFSIQSLPALYPYCSLFFPVFSVGLLFVSFCFQSLPFTCSRRCLFLSAFSLCLLSVSSCCLSLPALVPSCAQFLLLLTLFCSLFCSAACSWVFSVPSWPLSPPFSVSYLLSDTSCMLSALFSFQSLPALCSYCSLSFPLSVRRLFVYFCFQSLLITCSRRSLFFQLSVSVCFLFLLADYLCLLSVPSCWLSLSARWSSLLSSVYMFFSLSVLAALRHWLLSGLLQYTVDSTHCSCQLSVLLYFKLRLHFIFSHLFSFSLSFLSVPSCKVFYTVSIFACFLLCLLSDPALLRSFLRTVSNLLSIDVCPPTFPALCLFQLCLQCFARRSLSVSAYFTALPALFLHCKEISFMFS